MKKPLNSMILMLFGIILFASANQVFGQQASPRTGNMPVKEVVLLETFNGYPPEIQTIILENPQLYVIQEPVEIMHKNAFEKLSVEKQNYILEHPEKFQISERDDLKINVNETNEGVKQ